MVFTFLSFRKDDQNRVYARQEIGHNAHLVPNIALHTIKIFKNKLIYLSTCHVFISLYIS